MCMVYHCGNAADDAAVSFCRIICGHWAKDEINRWSDRGVIQGHDGDFEPNSPITRADMRL